MPPRKKLPPAEPALPVKRELEGGLEPPELIRLEKNLSSLCFFTPSSTKTRGGKGKSFNFTRLVDGKKVEAKVTIAPSTAFRLPVTSDQDKYFALQKIINDLKQKNGEVTNPIAFSSAELLRLLGKRIKTGKNYEDISEWLDVMTTTTVISEGAVYLAGKKKFAKDRFHVFERAISYGQELPDGSVADKNYIWLSPWQLENINQNYLLPVDFDTYKELKNHIAKALVPLLQIWLYASRDAGSFEKRYDEICQMLDLRQYSALSKIKEKLGPALDELQQHGYLAAWAVEPTNNKKHYKVVLWPGAKFQANARRLTPVEQGREVATVLPFEDELAAAPEPAPVTPPDPLLGELTRRGILQDAAQALLVTLAAGQPVLDQLEYADWLIAQGGKKFRNPPGFYLHLLKGNVMVPETFDTSRKRQLREQSYAAQAKAERALRELEETYEEYRRQAVDQYIQAALGAQAYTALLEAKRQELLQRYQQARWWDEGVMQPVVTGMARAEIVKEHLTLYDFDAFRQHYRQTGSFPPVTTPAQ